MNLTLEAIIPLPLGNFVHQVLERVIADKQFSALLVLADLPGSHSHQPEPLGLFRLPLVNSLQGVFSPMVGLMQPACLQTLMGWAQFASHWGGIWGCPTASRHLSCLLHLSSLTGEGQPFYLPSVLLLFLPSRKNS